MVVHKEVIQNIRLKKQLAALQAQLEAGRLVSEQLLALSGLLDKGIDPRQIPASHEAIQDLLKLAEQLEVQEGLLDDGTLKPTGRIQV